MFEANLFGSMISTLLGLQAGVTSIWFGFVLFPRLLPPCPNWSLFEISKRVWLLTDPTSQADFLATYGLILGDLGRLALYRIGQSVTALAPVCLLFLPVHFYLTAPWHFFVGATIGSLAGLVFVWQNVRSRKDSR